MRLTIPGRTLLGLLKTVAPAASGNTPSLNCALLQVKDWTLTATCTNLEEFISQTVELPEVEGASVVGAGDLVLPLEMMAVLPSLSHKDVTLQSDGKSVLLTAGKTKQERPTSPVADFPSLPVAGGTPLFRIESHKLKRLLHLTSFSMLKSRVGASICTGLEVRLEENCLRLVSTEAGNRISAAADPSCGDWEASSFVLPATAVHLLQKTLADDGMTICCTDGKMVRFTVGDVQIVTRTLDGRFPDCLRMVRRLKSLTKRTVVANRVVLLDACRRLLAVAELDGERAGRGVFHIKADVICMKSESVAGPQAEEEVQVEATVKTDAPSDVGFACSVPFLVDVLERLNCESVELRAVDGKTPICVVPVGDSHYTHVIGVMQ